jgi:sulfotransferase
LVTEAGVVAAIHFISGLPRSGSTLLSALLRQNPRFSAGVTSPLSTLCGTLHQKMGTGEFSVFFDEPRRAAMLRGLFETYYQHLPVMSKYSDGAIRCDEGY